MMQQSAMEYDAGSEVVWGYDSERSKSSHGSEDFRPFGPIVKDFAYFSKPTVRNGFQGDFFRDADSSTTIPDRVANSIISQKHLKSQLNMAV